MAKASQIPQLSKEAFWSGKVPSEEKQFTEWKHGIIMNVFENGSFDDMMELIVYYGRESVIESLKNAVPLKRSTLNFCCAIFNLKHNEFKCFTENRFSPF